MLYFTAHWKFTEIRDKAHSSLYVTQLDCPQQYIFCCASYLAFCFGDSQIYKPQSTFSITGVKLDYAHLGGYTYCCIPITGITHMFTYADNISLLSYNENLQR